MFSKHQRCVGHIRRLSALFDKCEIRSIPRHWPRSIAGLQATQGTDGGQELQEMSKPFRNEPFVKDLFLGKVDKTFLVYPEVRKTEELNDLKDRLEPVERFFKEEVDSKAIDVTGKIPETTMTRMRELGLFGQQVDRFNGGMGLNSKEYTRLNEIIGLDGSIASVLTSHQDLALQSILLYGTDEQREQYLTDLAQGKKIAAYCVAEKDCGSDIGSIKMTARQSVDSNSFILNGTKTWVTNGTVADIFVVFARTEVDYIGQTEEHISAFIVDRSTPGVSFGQPDPKLGLNGALTCDVNFDNTEIPTANLIGEIGAGFQMVLSTMNNTRVAEGAAVTGLLKHLTGLAAEHVINRKQFQKPLSSFGLVQDRLAQIALKTYVLESMTYLTAGTNDKYQSPDTGLESAIVKIYATEAAWSCMGEFMQLFGATACLQDSPIQRHLRDSYTSSTIKGTNDMLRLYVSLLGLQHAGQVKADDIRKTNNPFTNVGYAFKRNMKRIRTDPMNPKAVLKLYDHIHPTMSMAAEEYEKRIHQFMWVVEYCMGIYSTEILNEQITLKGLADIAVDLYGMTAVLSRASRSMSIGLKNADHEILLAQLFVREASQRIHLTLQHLREGKYENGDEVKRKLAETMFKARGYAATHPLERNW